jgi:hypothetical protein
MLFKYLKNNTYIANSIINIDNYIIKNDYKKAFLIMILVLERFDNDGKIALIDYYSKKQNYYYNFVSHLDCAKSREMNKVYLELFLLIIIN